MPRRYRIYLLFRQVHPELRQGERTGLLPIALNRDAHPAVRSTRPSGAGGERPSFFQIQCALHGDWFTPHGRAWRRGGLVRRPVLCGLLRYLRPGILPHPGWHGSKPWRRRCSGRRASPWTWGTVPDSTPPLSASNSMSRPGQALLPSGGFVGDSAAAHYAGFRAGPVPAFQTLRLQRAHALHRRPGGGD